MAASTRELSASQNAQDMSAYEFIDFEQLPIAQYYRTLFELAPSVYLITDENGLIKAANDAAAAMLKIDVQRLLGWPLPVFVIKNQQSDFRKFLLKARSRITTQRCECWIQPRMGSPVEVEVAVRYAPSEDGASTTMWWMLHDITEHSRIQEQLMLQNEQLESLNQKLLQDQEQLQIMSRKLMHIQEEERTIIARELHDEIGQTMTGVKFLLEHTRQQASPEVQKTLNDAIALIQHALSQLRNLSLDLHPPMLDDMGLFATLLWHFERYTAQTNIVVEFRHHGRDTYLGPNVKLAAYRVVQEALTNVARHACTQTAVVKLNVHKDSLSLMIEDQGIGFNVNKARRQYQSSGLTSMQERARMLGGGADIKSRPNRGTKVRVRLPLSLIRRSP